jgi:hypothetical protein
MDPFAPPRTTDPAPEILLLGALAWICADDDRAGRLLALTGLDAEELRLHAADPATLSAIGAYLCDHEPDLFACAVALDCSPQTLVTASRRIDAA